MDNDHWHGQTTPKIIFSDYEQSIIKAICELEEVSPSMSANAAEIVRLNNMIEHLKLKIRELIREEESDG